MWHSVNRYSELSDAPDWANHFALFDTDQNKSEMEKGRSECRTKITSVAKIR